MNEKALRAGCASRGIEVSCKQHRQGAKESQATLCSSWDSAGIHGSKSLCIDGKLRFSNFLPKSQMQSWPCAI